MRSMECFDLKKFSGHLARSPPTYSRHGLKKVLGLVVWALWCIPPWQVEQVRVIALDTPEKYASTASQPLKMSTAEHSSRVLAASSSLWGCMTWRRIVATEENVRVAQENVSVAHRKCQRRARKCQRATRRGPHRPTGLPKQLRNCGDKEMAIRVGRDLCS